MRKILLAGVAALSMSAAHATDFASPVPCSEEEGS